MADPADRPPRVLAFSAHAADFCSRSGGTLAKYARRGSAVRVVALTFGERGESGELWQAHPELSVEEVKTIRRQEAEAAAQALGAEIRFLDWDDYPLFIDKGRLLQLVDQVREARPDLVLTHWPYDPFNQDHQVTAEAVIRACSCAGAAGLKLAHPPARYPALFFFEPTVPLTEAERFDPDTYIDVTETFAQKMQALAEFRAQPQLSGWYTRYGEQRAMQARTLSGRAGIQYAEAFKRYRPRVADWLE